MKVEIFGYPEFRIPLTLNHVELLSKLALLHYDRTCQEAAKVGGFIYGWKNSIEEFIKLDSRNVPPSVGKARDLDLCLKILEFNDFESAVEKTLAVEMRSVFRGSLECARSNMPKWHATFRAEFPK